MEITAKMVKDLREKTGAGMMDCKKALNEANGNIEKAMNWLREKGIAKGAKRESKVAAEGLAKIFIDGNKAVILEVNSETDFVSKNEEFIEMVDTISKSLVKSSAKNMDEAKKVKTAKGTIEEIINDKVAKIGEKLSFRRFKIVEKQSDEEFGSYIHMGGKIAALVVIKGKKEDVAKDVAMQAAAMKPLYCFSKDVPADVLDNEKQVLTEQAINEGKPKEIAAKIVNGRIDKFYQDICLNDQVFIKDSKLKVKDYLKNNKCELVEMIRYEVGEGITKKEENFADEVMSQIKKD